MSGTPWPRVLDMSEDDSRKALRSLELSTYSSIIATFRAQGDLTPQKKTLLHQLQTLFGYDVNAFSYIILLWRLYTTSNFLIMLA